jgi:hypothetical protein
MQEGLDHLSRDLAAIDAPLSWRRGFYNRFLFDLLQGRDTATFLSANREALLNGTIGEEALEKLIRLFILTIHDQRKREETARPCPEPPLPAAS